MSESMSPSELGAFASNRLYSLRLPITRRGAPQSQQPSALFTKRFVKGAVAALTTVILFVLWCILQPQTSVRKPVRDPRLYAPIVHPRPPSLFTHYHEHELQILQHNLNDSQQRQAKYLRIPRQTSRTGWGNVMQEILLNHYLAYRTGRIFVFENYTWHEDGWLDYVHLNHGSVATQVPLSLFIRGPTVGAPVANGTLAPSAVLQDFWDTACPLRMIISSAEITSGYGSHVAASTLIEAFAKYLESNDDPMYANSTRLLSVWPSFSHSPILQDFGWSSLVELAFDTNRELIAPSTTLDPYLTATPFTTPAERYKIISGLLVLHVRRGTFEDWCSHVADVGAGYNGYNMFPSLPDKLDFDLPAETRVQRAQRYRQHCYPAIWEIVRRVEEIRQTHAAQGLRNVYIMTNAQTPWVLNLKAALRRTGYWENVASSRDLLLNREQKYVKQPLDMLIGQRAQVFIGNGVSSLSVLVFSSLSGQVVMLRMANGLPAETSRLW
ncbi:hypothetical protein IEO21_09132 [Rhodonia placenta]|uniref:Uncharacterized protein n=1 Tax=Rhodonia placenta TaxID=104341 RepID=A0A8H7NV29_9APHY|nr:hypothetical protein IEO21_09132 [Postia placenta]